MPVPRLRTLLWPALVTAALACVRLEPPALPPPAPVAVERPLVLVPGVTGSSLWDPATGEVAFGSGRSFLCPRDGGYRIAPALDGADGLKALDVIRRIRLAWVDKPVYQPVVDAAVRMGYRLGDLERPEPEDSLFLFAYDWRDDNVASSRRLAALLEGVRQARGEERLAVDLLCQSNGAHVCRWFAKYRDLRAAEVEAGRGPATRLDVAKLVLLGTSNGGSLRILREMNRERRYLPWIGRVFRPEVFFAMRSLYQDLPHDAASLFVDAEGDSLDVDLYDAASWERYGWSVFDPQAARRVARNDPEGRFGTADERSTFLRDALAQARRFQRLLASDAPAWAGATTYLLENGTRSTPHRAVLRRTAHGWETLFPDEPGLRAALRERLLAPGDGHATLASQRRLSAQELAGLRQVRRIEGAHFESILETGTLEAVLDVLAQPLTRGR
jgi:hypothetical protein